MKSIKLQAEHLIIGEKLSYFYNNSHFCGYSIYLYGSLLTAKAAYSNPAKSFVGLQYHDLN